MNDVNLNISGDIDPIIKNTSTILTPISQAVAGAFLYVFQKPIEYGIVKNIEHEALAKQTREKFSLIPQENIDFNNIPLLTKLLEDSIYQLSSEEFRDLYSSLIVSSIDKTKEVKPFYSSLLKDMSPNEAQLLDYFFEHQLLFEVALTSDNPNFITEGTYRYYWEPQLFKITRKPDRIFYRNFRTESHYEGLYTAPNDFYQLDTLDSFLFLLNNGIIERDYSSSWNGIFPSLKKYLLENDEIALDLQEQNKFLKHPVNFEFKYKAYKLTSLGESLKSILKFR